MIIWGFTALHSYHKLPYVFQTICLLYIIIPTISSGQHSSYRHKILTTHDGLTSQLCTNAAEDSLGNIWISGFRDISKYNGYSIKNFNNSNSNLAGTYINQMIVDQRGKVWVVQNVYQDDVPRSSPESTYVLEVNVIDPIDDSFMSLDEYLDNAEIKASNIENIQLTSAGIVIITKNRKIYRWAEEGLNLLCQIDSLKTLVGVSNSGYYHYKKNSVYYTSYTDTIGTTYIEDIDLSVYTFFQTNNNGEIIFVSPKELPLVNSSKIFRDTTPISLDHIHYPGSNLKSDHSFTNMFIQVNIDDDIFTRIGNKIFINDDPVDLLSVMGYENIDVYSLSRTRSGLILIASNMGLFIINSSPSPFYTFQTNSERMNSTKGLIISDDISGYSNIEEILISPSKKYDNLLDVTATRNVGLLYTANKELTSVWSIGHYKNLSDHLRHIDLENETIKYYPIPYLGDGRGIFYSENSGKVYVYGGVIATTDLMYQGIRTLKSYTDHYKGVNITCNHIVSKDNKLWIATDKGLMTYDERSDKYNDIEIFNEREEQIEFIHFDRTYDSIVWLATKANGVLKWNRNNQNITEYNSHNGLSNNNTHSIHEDDNDRLWISTNHNLNCLDKETELIYIYTTDDGISHSEFNKNSYFFDEKTGNVYFGGLNGYTFFNPDSVFDSRMKNFQPRLIDADIFKKDFSKFSIYDQVALDNKIELDEKDAQLELEFTTDQYLHLDNTNYLYRLREISKEWNIAKNHIIQLAKPPYGSYTLELKAEINNDSEFSSLYELAVEVPTPLWKKTWLRILIFLLVILLVYRYIKLRNRKLEHENSLLENANKSKNKLFTLLAHDLRNPLASLSNLTKKVDFLIKKDRIGEIKDLVTTVESKVDALNDNLNSILSWTILEDGVLSYNPVNVDVKEIIDQLLTLFYESISAKQIKFKNHLDAESYVYCDKSILQAIIRNGFSNAIKFCSIEGEINISMHDYENQKILKITNTYNKSMEESGEYFGSGVGLKISEELAHMAGVKISLDIDYVGHTIFKITM